MLELPILPVIISTNSSKSIVPEPSRSISAIILRTFSFFESKPSARSATWSSLVSIVPEPSVSKRSNASRSSCICHSGMPGRAVTGAREPAAPPLAAPFLYGAESITTGGTNTKPVENTKGRKRATACEVRGSNYGVRGGVRGVTRTSSSTALHTAHFRALSPYAAFLPFVRTAERNLDTALAPARGEQ